MYIKENFTERRDRAEMTDFWLALGERSQNVIAH